MIDSPFRLVAINFLQPEISIYKLQIFHFANYIFSFQKLQIFSLSHKSSISISFRFVSQTTVSPCYESTRCETMIKWWHQNNWGKAACGRRTRALKCWRSCACKHSKFLVLEICLIVCNLSSNNFCALWQKRLFWSASIYCCSFLAEIEQLCYVNIQFEHSVQTRNSSIPTSSVNIQLKHSIQTFNANIQFEHSLQTFNVHAVQWSGAEITARGRG